LGFALPLVAIAWVVFRMPPPPAKAMPAATMVRTQIRCASARSLSRFISWRARRQACDDGTCTEPAGGERRCQSWRAAALRRESAGSKREADHGAQGEGGQHGGATHDTPGGGPRGPRPCRARAATPGRATAIREP
jgi:hypothetical protein